MLYINQNEFRYVSKLEKISSSVCAASLILFILMLLFIMLTLFVNDVLTYLLGALAIIAMIVLIISAMVVDVEKSKRYKFKIENNSKLICEFNNQTITLEFPCEMKRVEEKKSKSGKEKDETKLVLNGCLQVSSTDEDENGRTVEEFLERVVRI